MARKPHVGSAAIVRDPFTGWPLLGRRAKPEAKGMWVFPGGGIKPFESIADAAKRELREEAGIEIVLGEQVGAFEIIDEPTEHRIVIVSWATAKPGEVLAPGGDIDALGYFSPLTVAQYVEVSDFTARVMRHVGWVA